MADFGLDCVLTCSDPERVVMDIAGEGSVDQFTDQVRPSTRAAALADKQLQSLQVPDPMAAGRMRDRVDSINAMRRLARPGMSIVGWIEGPLASPPAPRG